MTENPIPVLLIACLVVVFEGMLGIVPFVDPGSVPIIGNVQPEPCADENFFSDVFCAAKYAVSYTVNLLSMILAGVAWFVKLITFSIPGIPLYAQLILAVGINGTFLWSILQLVRGN